MRSEVRASPEAEHTVWWLLLCRAVEQRVRAALAERAEPVAVQACRPEDRAILATPAGAELVSAVASALAAPPALPPDALQKQLAFGGGHVAKSAHGHAAAYNPDKHIVEITPLRDEQQRKGGERG